MKVSLVSITKSLIRGPVDRYLTAEEHVVYCARVSNPSNQLNLETAPKLLKYCITNSHWSIFEQVSAAFEIVTSKAISAQILRHKSANFQEYSGRYSAITELEPVELRLQAEKNRQSSTDILNDPILEDKVAAHMESSVNLYNELLANKVAKESARFVLPLSMRTTMYMNNTLRGWIHYLDVRDDEHTQKEHQLIAKEIKSLLINEFPNTAEALDWKN